jgi:hypothetical protein
MTDREIPTAASASHDDYLGRGGTDKERGRSPLQTSALPLGYGAARRKLANYLDFLNPPPEVVPTSFKPLSCRRLQYRRVTNGSDPWPSPVPSRNTPLAKSRWGDFCG